MIPEFRIRVEFHGPSLCDLLPIMDNIAPGETVEAKWTASRQDYLALEKVEGRKLRLVVPDAETRDKTLWQLGGALEISPADLDAARGALVTKGQHHEWRAKVLELGYAQGTMLLCKVMSSALLAGKKPRNASVSIARECLLDRISPADADVLMRLRTAR